MKPFALLLMTLLMVLSSSISLDAADIEGSKDHPMITRMPNYEITQYDQKNFDSQVYYVKDTEVIVEGKKTVIFYTMPEGGQKASNLEIVRNYTAALKKIGASILEESDRYAVAKLVKDSRETWFSVESFNEGNDYQLTINEKKEMEQSVTAKQDEMISQMKTSGHVAVYGIHFDSGKSDIQPDSEAAIKSIADILKSQPDMKVFIIGHTDMDGDFEANMILSEARAAAVVKELTEKYMIDTSRMTPKGLGPLSPVAGNDTEDGKAKNRRVELVVRG